MLETYANRVVVQHTATETTVTFGLQLPPLANADGAVKAVVRVILPWSVANELAVSLTDGLQHAAKTFAEVQP